MTIIDDTKLETFVEDFSIEISGIDLPGGGESIAFPMDYFATIEDNEGNWNISGSIS